MERSEALSFFTDVTKADAEMAQHYLEACQWDLEAALNIWTTNENTQRDVDEINRLDIHEEKNIIISSPRSNEAVDNDNKEEDDDDIIRETIEESLRIHQSSPRDFQNVTEQNRNESSIQCVDFLSSDDDYNDNMNIDMNGMVGPSELRNGEIRRDDSDIPHHGPLREYVKNDDDDDALVHPMNPSEDEQQSRAVESDQINENEVFYDLPNGMDQRDVMDQRMLESVLLGRPYTGEIPDYTNPSTSNSLFWNSVTNREPPKPPSPSTLEAREVIKETDAAFDESLRRDREKKEEALKAEQLAKIKEEEEREAKMLEKNRKEREIMLLKEVREQKRKALPLEPSKDDNDIVNVMIRFPDGEKLSRRFKVTDDIKCLFYYVDANTVTKNEDLTDIKDTSEHKEDNENDKFEILPGNYNLVTQFPRRILSETGNRTLKEIGLDNKFEALFIELK